MAEEEAAAEVAYQRLPEGPQDIFSMRWLTPRDRAIIRAASQGATAFPDHYQGAHGAHGVHGIHTVHQRGTRHTSDRAVVNTHRNYQYECGPSAWGSLAAAQGAHGVHLTGACIPTGVSVPAPPSPYGGPAPSRGRVVLAAALLAPE